MTNSEPDEAPAILDALSRPHRLGVLDRTGLLDAPATDRYDRFTRLATAITGAPTALISLVTSTRQFFASHEGLPEPWASRRETPLTHSFCKHVVATAEPLVIPDAREDERVRDNRAVDEIGVRAYAGMPIVLDGEVIGSFCAIHGEPHEWTSAELDAVGDLASLVVDQLLLERAVQVAEERRRMQGQHALRLHEDIARHVRTARLAEQLGSPEKVAAELAAAERGIDGLIDELAAVATEGGPVELESVSGFSELSTREVQVYDLIATGLSNQEIATRLGISVDTTKKHVSSVLRKLGVPSRSAAIARRTGGA